MISYQLMYLLAIAGGTAILLDEGHRRRLGARWPFAVLAWAMGGVIGAALPYHLLGDLVAPRTAVGAVAGATIALCVAAIALGLSTGRALDTTATAIPLAGALARLGCFAAECCQGIATNLPLGVIDEDGIRRHPTQLYEAGFDVIVAAIVSRSAGRRSDGHRFLVSLSAMSVGRFAIEFVRDSDKLGPLSLAQWITAPVAIIAMVVVARRIELPRPRPRSVALTALALQMPVISADSTYPRIYTSIGAGAFGGAFDIFHDNGSCDAEEDWTRHHSIRGGALEVGMRRQNKEQQSVGMRVRAFSAVEQASESFDHHPAIAGWIFQPYSARHSGLTLIGDFDWQYFGVSAGGTVGKMYPIAQAGGDDAQGRGVRHAWFSGGVRAGSERAGLEFRVGDEQPAGLPMPSMTLGVGIGNGVDTRVRFGMSEMGVFLTGRHITKTGFEVDPMVTLGGFKGISGGGVERGFSGGLMVRKWLRTDPKR